MSDNLIQAGGDVIAEKVREQLLTLSDQVSEEVAHAVALSVIAGAAAAFRQLSVKAPDLKEKLIVGAINGPKYRSH